MLNLETEDLPFCRHGDEGFDALGSSLGILALRGISRTFLYHGGFMGSSFFKTPSCHSLLTCKNNASHKHLSTLFFVLVLNLPREAG